MRVACARSSFRSWYGSSSRPTLAWWWRRRTPKRCGLIPTRSKPIFRSVEWGALRSPLTCARTQAATPRNTVSSVQFELVGSLIGLAIYNSVILDVNFPLVVYRKLKRETVTLRDLEDFRPQIARTMRMLLEYAGDDFEDVFGLNFTVTYESWGTNKTQELVPGGADKPVTLANRKVRPCLRPRFRRRGWR